MSISTPTELLQRLIRLEVFEPPRIDVIAVPPPEETVELEQYRREMASRRVDLLGRSGVWLDRSPTGSGKSTADVAAFQRAARGLSVQPAHTNCADEVKQLNAGGIDAVAYPGRFTCGKNKNCWNTAADQAEKLGLWVVAAVCRFGCEHQAKCLQGGYLAEVSIASHARVSVATHARAVHAGLDRLSEGRDLVSIHEDCLNILAPQWAIPADLLATAKFVVERLLNDPTWLNRFGPVFEVDRESRTRAKNERASDRRDAQYTFFRHLADTIDAVIATLSSTTDGVAAVPITTTMVEPSGVQAVLFRASQELGITFNGHAVWRVLLRFAAGSFYQSGVLTRGRLGT